MKHLKRNTASTVDTMRGPQLKNNILQWKIDNNMKKHGYIAGNCIFIPMEGNEEICSLCGMSKYLHKLNNE